MLRDPLVVTPNTPLMAAIAQMSTSQVSCEVARSMYQREARETDLLAKTSCVLVLEAGQVIGILTERDIVRLCVERQSLADIVVRQVMVSPVICLRQSALRDIVSTTNLLQQHNIRHLPILDDQQQLVGLITHQGLQQVIHPIDLLRLRLVHEVMVAEVVCAPTEVSLKAVAQLMVKHRVSSVIVMASEPSTEEAHTVVLSGLTEAGLANAINTPAPQCPVSLSSNPHSSVSVGILTEHDLVQFQALGLQMDDYSAGALMSTPIFAVKPEESLWTVQKIMQRHLIHRVLVTGNAGELLGIVTQTSLLQALNPLELYKLTTVLEAKVGRLEAEKVALLESRASELERQVQARTIDLKRKVEREHLLQELALKIHSSLELQTILDTTVDQVKRLLVCDRVNVWQFMADWRTVVIAESTDSAVSLIGETINDTCFDQTMAEVYAQGRVRVVSDIYTTEMSDCHRDMLIRLHTRAKILVPLMAGEQLWGLLNVTESQHARNWQSNDIEVIKALSLQLGIALQQATTYQQLQESEQSYESLAKAVPVGIFRTDAAGHCLYVNERWCQIAGISAETATQRGWEHALHPEDRDRVIAEWYCAVQAQREFKLEFRFQAPDGNVTWVYSQGVPEQSSQGQQIRYVGTITDMTQLKRAKKEYQQMAGKREALRQQLRAQTARCTHALRETVDELQAELTRNKQIGVQVASHARVLWETVDELQTEVMQREILEESLRDMNQQLEAQSRLDGLTQIANRYYFDQQFYREWKTAHRENTALSLILLDVDYFKQYNDYYGHQQGDTCLQQLAQASRKAIHRPADLLARYGGEEFILLLPKTDQDGAIKVAESLRKEIAALNIPHEQSAVSAIVTVSSGIAAWHPALEETSAAPEVRSQKELLARADQALYQAKRLGRDRYVVVATSTEL